MRLGDRRELAEALRRIRRQTLGFFADADSRALDVPCLAMLNPPLWELGHIGWFQEYWCLRWPLPASSGPQTDVALGSSRLSTSDSLYNSSHVAHASRWSLPLPDLVATRDYLEWSLEATLDRLASADESDEDLYFFRLALFHECMHAEAFACTWHTLGRAALSPDWQIGGVARPRTSLRVPGGSVWIGRLGPGFQHDNEWPACETPVEACLIGAAPVTNSEYLSFVQAGGYADARWWNPEVYAALVSERRRAPRGWRPVGASRDEVSTYAMKWFDRHVPLDPDAPVVHVDAHEAQAYCSWAGKRLPTEAQWRRAATDVPGFEWGNHVWEWTASAFDPLPGFRPGPYRDYSAPWFGDHRVVRGGSFFTPREMVDTDFRNFYLPDRADPFLGFRVCE